MKPMEVKASIRVPQLVGNVLQHTSLASQCDCDTASSDANRMADTLEPSMENHGEQDRPLQKKKTALACHPLMNKRCANDEQTMMTTTLECKQRGQMMALLKHGG